MMSTVSDKQQAYMRESRLYLEEICCLLLRFQHIRFDGLAPEDVKISREVFLGSPGCFADIRVEIPGAPPYFVEVKYGYSPPKILRHLKRKYVDNLSGSDAASKIILVVGSKADKDWAETQTQIHETFHSGPELEIWDEKDVLTRVEEIFGIRMDSISESSIVELKEALDRAMFKYAFEYEHVDDALRQSLLWHFSAWRLKALFEKSEKNPRAIMPPEIYRKVVVLSADLSSFSSYVRDTRDNEVIRHALTSYCSKAGYEIRNTGGMMYQFVGDEIVGLYGIPERLPGYFEKALESAMAIVDIGDSVSSEWQRQIDRVQKAGGVHIGMAVGDVQIVSLRPFGRAHFSAVSDALNMASRLQGVAGPGEVVVSNTYYQLLGQDFQSAFSELPPVEAKNLGIIRAWKMNLKNT